MFTFVPTVTTKFKKYNYDGVNQVLLSPSYDMILPDVETIIIDNYGFIMNHIWYVKNIDNIYKYFFRHVEICKELTKYENLIFILPDIKLIPEFRNDAIEYFLHEVNPKRYSLVDMCDFNIHFPDLYSNCEFLSIPYKMWNQRTCNSNNRYHVLSGELYKMPNGIRSWDTSKIPSGIPLKEVVKEYNEKSFSENSN